MTEKDLDRLMRQVLIDAAKLDRTKRPSPAFRPSRAYQRQVRAMLRDPLRWSARRSRPALSPVMRQVAMFALVTVLGLAATIVSVPSARASVVRWVEKWVENTIEFRYSGEQDNSVLPEYGITALPEGYVETHRELLGPSMMVVDYEDEKGGVILFDYSRMQQGSMTFFETEGSEVLDIMVNQKPGKYFQTLTPGNNNTIYWIDNSANISFVIDAPLDFDVMLHMAENVKLVKTPN